MQHKLPNGPMRIVSLVERAITDMPPPLDLPEEIVGRLREIDIQLQACYASMEDLNERLDTFTAEMTRIGRRATTVDDVEEDATFNR